MSPGAPTSRAVFLQERGDVCTKSSSGGSGAGLTLFVAGSAASSLSVPGVPAALDMRQGHRAVDTRARALVVLWQRVQPALGRGSRCRRRVSTLASGQVHTDHLAQVPGARRPRVRRGRRAAAGL